MKNKKQLTIEDIFCGMPHLRAYFQEMDRMIKKYKGAPAVDELKIKRSALLKTAKEIQRTDLQLLYYIHHYERIYPHTVLHAFQKLFIAQCELKNLLSGTDIHKDQTE